MGIRIKLKPHHERTFNGVRIANRGRHEVDLEIDASEWLTEEHGRRRRVHEDDEDESD